MYIEVEAADQIKNEKETIREQYHIKAVSLKERYAEKIELLDKRHATNILIIWILAIYAVLATVLLFWGWI